MVCSSIGITKVKHQWLSQLIEDTITVVHEKIKIFNCNKINFQKIFFEITYTKCSQINEKIQL